MSDSDNDNFMIDEEEEEQDYEFEYEGSDQDQDQEDALVENSYYAAKETTNADDALEEFRAITKSNDAEWKFRSIKQSIKICIRNKRLIEAFDLYNELLHEVVNNPKITKNYAEKSLNNMLELAKTVDDLTFVEKFYSLTLGQYKSNDDKFQIKTLLHLARIWLQNKAYGQLQPILVQLHQLCLLAKPIVQQEDSSDPQTFSPTAASSFEVQRSVGNLLEVYTIELELYSQTKNNIKLREVHSKCVQVLRTAIVHPRLVGIIKECGGKTSLKSEQWTQARQDFYDAFRSYDESGEHDGRIRCLKYLILSSMLTNSEVDPFDSQETKPWKDTEEGGIVHMYSLIKAFQDKDIKQFQKVLSKYSTVIVDDFIRPYMEEIVTSIRAIVIQQVVGPYTTVKLSFLQDILGGGISVQQVEDICALLITGGKIQASIDSLSGILRMEVPSVEVRQPIIDLAEVIAQMT